MPSESQHLSHQTKPHYGTPQLTPPPPPNTNTTTACTHTHMHTQIDSHSHTFRGHIPSKRGADGGKACPTVVVTSDLQHDGRGHMHVVCECECECISMCVCVCVCVCVCEWVVVVVGGESRSGAVPEGLACATKDSTQLRLVPLTSISALTDCTQIHTLTYTHTLHFSHSRSD